MDIQVILKMLVKKKSQIAIFVILAVMIIFLIIFLVYFSYDGNKNVIIGGPDSSLNILKDNVDICLERQLKKAAMIVGVRGGFIFDEGENYFSSVVSEDFYDAKLIEKLNLDYSYLTGGVLLHSDYEVYSPEFYNFTSTSTGGVYRVVYNHSIKEDFEKYLLDEFLSCMKFAEVSLQGFNLNYENFTSSIDTQIQGTNIIHSDSILGNVGDNIVVVISSNEYYGKILSNDFDNEFSEVEFEKNILENLGNVDLEDLVLRNINSSVSLKVFFNDESIAGRIFFPVSISNGINNFFFKTSYVEINVRLKKLLDFSKALLDAKTRDRSLDFHDISIVDEILRNNVYYYRNLDLDLDESLVFYKTELFDSTLEHKKFIYTFEDKASRVLGFPYIFNFAYKNDAPYLDKVKIFKDGTFKLEGNSLLYVSLSDFQVNLNLRDLVSDDQYLDIFLSEDLFIPKSVSTQSYDFELKSNGDISFFPKFKGINSVNIQLSDGEATRTENLIFVLGEIKNENNENANFCFNFDGAKISSKNNPFQDIFPVRTSYSGIQNLLFVDNLNYNHVFVYNLYSNENFLNSNGLDYSAGRLIFKRSCYDYGDFIQLKFVVKNKLTGDILRTEFIENIHQDLYIDLDDSLLGLPYSNIPLDLEVHVLNKNTGEVLLDDPYTISLYPRQCLGPRDLSQAQRSILNSGVGSCCNLDNSPLNSIPDLNLAHAQNIRNSGKVVDTEMYFIYSFFGADSKFDSSIGLFDTSSSSLWGRNMLLSNPTSLFKGRTVSTCNGLFPKFEDVMDVYPVGSPDSLLNNKKIQSYFSFSSAYQVNLKSGTYDRRRNFGVSRVLDLEMCNFIALKNKSLFKFEIDIDNDGSSLNNLIFDSGFVSSNGDDLINDFGLSKEYEDYLTSALPSSSNYNDVFIKCGFDDDDWYGSENSFTWTLNPVSGYALNSNLISISQGFCSSGSFTCEGRINSPGFSIRRANNAQCTNYEYSGSDGIINEIPASSSTLCYSNGVWDVLTCDLPSVGTYRVNVTDAFCSGLGVGYSACQTIRPSFSACVNP